MEPKIRRILVPVVFKEYSLNTCMYAMALAEKINAEIKLFHVCKTKSKGVPFSEYGFQTTEGGGSIMPETEAKYEIERICNELREQILKRNIKNVAVNYSLAKGIATEEIVKMSKVYKPHLIILGTRGEEKKSRALLESETIKIIERTTTSVLAIPQDTVFQDKDSLNILYATDFNESDFSSFNKLLLLLSSFKVKIFCVHVEVSKEIKDDKMKALRDRLKTEYGQYEIKCILTQSDNLFKGIQDFINNNHIDLFSFTSQRKTVIQKLFSPDKLKKMLFYTNIPLLVFHS